ncbi:MAG: crossover junction endodeoxyribonuclease RuvC [Anaerolineales bacterium]|nr:crossover junction endodeoxyribonuclease RuvC [Anaerolineales bacterium]
MLVIGIDPGTAITGFGVVRQSSQGGLETVDFGVITTPPDHAMPRRLHQLYNELSTLITLHQPESGAVEKLYFQRNVSTAISVGQARGVVLLALAQARIPVDEYSPREVKQAVVGHGNADKRQMQEMVRTLLEMREIPHPDDAADALAVAICHLHSSRTLRRLEENS